MLEQLLQAFVTIFILSKHTRCDWFDQGHCIKERELPPQRWLQCCFQHGMLGSHCGLKCIHAMSVKFTYVCHSAAQGRHTDAHATLVAKSVVIGLLVPILSIILIVHHTPVLIRGCIVSLTTYATSHCRRLGCVASADAFVNVAGNE